MIQNFGSAVAKWDVSRSWASRFLHRHADKITTKWSAGIDRNRLQADSGDKCKLYFDLLHAKMQEYNVEERDIYNMDEKGFFVGRTIRSKRIFSKASLAQKERTAALQDSNREWVTLLACVCTSGEALPPALIYQGTSGVQSSWIDDDEAEQHQVFVSHSPSGWTNNDLGLAWLTQVLNRYTKAKARRRWRLLLLDGHGSHVTADFIDFCDANHVVLFSPLSRNYTTELNRNSQRSQGLTSVTKRDFYSNFWAT
ncbi:DDE-1 domain containing protein [Pyrenophora tritici-repentis]|nr:DDE-1 domain containing protein [Pyrenophora tritici-repentis]